MLTQAHKPTERRRFPRVAKAFRVKLRIRRPPREESYETQSRDVNVGGVAIWIRNEMPLGTAIRATFISERPGLAFEVEGRIAWCAHNPEAQAYEAGIEFLNLDPESLERILALISEKGWGTARSQDAFHFDLPTELSIEYRPAGTAGRRGWRPSSCRRLSLREVFFRSEEPFGRGRGVEVRLHLPEDHGGTIECRGSVSQALADREGRWRIGVALDRIKRDERLCLAAYLISELQRPSP